MENVEVVINSKPVQEVLQQVARVMKWGKLTIEIKDGKAVMSKIEKAIKHS